MNRCDVLHKCRIYSWPDHVCIQKKPLAYDSGIFNQLTYAKPERDSSGGVNEHIEEKIRAIVFSKNGQMDSFGQIIGELLVGLVAQQFSVLWGLLYTTFLLLPVLFLVPVAGKNKHGI